MGFCIQLDEKIDNYVDELAPGVENISLGGYVTPQVRASAGEKFPVIYGVGFKRDENGNRLVDENGLPIAGEAQVIGKGFSGLPDGFQHHITLMEVYNQRSTRLETGWPDVQ